MGKFIPCLVIKRATGGQPPLLDGLHKGPGPNKRNVTGSALNVINNKSELSETDPALRMDKVWRPRGVARAVSIYVNHRLDCGLLLLGEAINLSGSCVTQAETK